MAVELYSKLDLKPQQQQLAAAVWEHWCSARVALDESFQRAVRGLHVLSASASLPLRALRLPPCLPCSSSALLPSARMRTAIHLPVHSERML